MKKIPPLLPSSCRPRIDYPCSWQYKLIGESKTAIRRAVEKHVHEQSRELTDSRVSRHGRYISMNLELVVDSEERRLELYRLLAADQAIKVVL
jgi:putative lipoic acid-binding regulatory protein